MIAIINYGSGNIRAIGNIYDLLKVKYKVVDSPLEVRCVDKIILPGVGSFDATMNKLNSSGMKDALNEAVIVNKCPILGICVGMQILGISSEEGNESGLGWINGDVKKFNVNLLINKPKLPHLGWNSIRILNNSPLFKGINEELGFYFIHSYFLNCNYSSDIAATTYYGSDFTSAVIHGNIFGVQFHPEKSHHNGVTLLKNFSIL